MLLLADRCCLREVAYTKAQAASSRGLRTNVLLVECAVRVAYAK